MSFFSSGERHRRKLFTGVRSDHVAAVVNGDQSRRSSAHGGHNGQAETRFRDAPVLCLRDMADLFALEDRVGQVKTANVRAL